MKKLRCLVARASESCFWPLFAAHVLIFAFMTGFYWRDQLRSIACTASMDEHCWRAWIDAGSGWAAAFAALAPIGILYWQFKEAQRQTDYVIGDALPTASLVRRTDGLEECRLRVTNWNRFPVELTAISITASFDIEVGPELEVRDKNDMQFEMARLDSRCRIMKMSWVPGFVDRSAPAPFVDLLVVIVPKTDRSFEVFAPMGVAFDANIHGEQTRSIKIELSSTAQHLIAYQGITVWEEDDKVVATIERRV